MKNENIRVFNVRGLGRVKTANKNSKQVFYNNPRPSEININENAVCQKAVGNNNYK